MSDYKKYVLVACEESQQVCNAFNSKWHVITAYSNDIIKCSGGHPETHIMDNALSVVNGGSFKLQNGTWIEVPHWDLIIAHPPCTYLSNAATGMHSLNKTPENRIEGRTLERISAMRFFMDMIRANCDHIAVENPVGIMNTAFRKPDQIINPYQFAESEDDTENYVTKATCLWLKGLPPLRTNNLARPDNVSMYGRKPNGVGGYSFTDRHGRLPKTQTGISMERDSVLRSKTFPGIAKAMAEQWGRYILEDDEE